jgi:hypothetical protein
VRSSHPRGHRSLILVAVPGAPASGAMRPGEQAYGRRPASNVPVTMSLAGGLTPGLLDRHELAVGRWMAHELALERAALQAARRA